MGGPPGGRPLDRQPESVAENRSEDSGVAMSLLNDDEVLTEDQRAICQGVRSIVSRFDDGYWLEHDESGEFPKEFHHAMAEAGWLGITMPAEYGGSGLGVTEAALMMRE